jgi:hypothetical protein
MAGYIQYSRKIWNSTLCEMGNIQIKFKTLYKDKDLLNENVRKKANGDLLKMCADKNLSFRCFDFLQRSLITQKINNLKKELSK